MTDDFPLIARVRQRFDTRTCGDVAQAVQQELAKLRLGQQIRPGQRVAITAGSRGISNIDKIVKSIAAHVRELQAEPFIVPAMGSHGGGTAAGQRQVIESYGITEEFCQCKILASMETVVIGEAAEGFPVYFDKHAFEADHVIICGRIKPHTNFAGDIQSGLMKMLMIGLGKKDGAALYHRAIHEFGFPRIIRSVAPKVLEKANVVAGLAIVENAMDETALIEAVAPADFQSRETELLALAKAWMPQLPFREIDVLVLDEIGKNVSGTGMDTNIIGRKQSERTAHQPNIKCIVIRNLTPETHGNATGLGLAEFCLSRVVEQMDRNATVVNCLTALDVRGARIPVHYASDAETLTAALGILGMKKPRDAQLVWIQNTGHLAQLECSEALLEEARGNANLDVLTPPRPLPLGAHGMLPDNQFAASENG